VEKRIALNGYGSTTFKKQAAERGAEPDECYVLGEPLGEVPHFAIEVVLTSGGIDKLAVYCGLGVPEVWFFHKGRFHLYELTDHGYEPIARSRFVPDLDVEALATFVERDDQTAAVIAYRDSLR
jgi:Uma2 family endonuclease